MAWDAQGGRGAAPRSRVRGEEAAAAPIAPGPRRAVPTRRLLWALASCLLLSLPVPLIPPVGWLWWSALAALGLLLGVDFLTRPPRASVLVERRLAPAYHVGRRGRYALALRNASPRTLRVELREVLPAELEGDGCSLELLLAPGEEQVREVEFVGLSRGAHPPPPLGLRVSSPAGLLAYQELRTLPGEVLVLPGRPAGETEWLLAQAATIDELGQRRVRQRGAEREFESLREYVVGDEVRKIDWKASARRRRPLVRLFETERNAELLLAVDTGRLMGSLIDGVPKLDLALTPVLDLAAVALRRGERVGLLAFDSQARCFVPPRGGLQQLGTLLEACARLPRPREPTSYLRAVRYLEAHHRKRCLLLVFTDFTDELSAQEMHASLAALTRRHVLVFVGVGDPHLARIADAPATVPREAFQRAVAAQLLEERRRVLAGMERLGVLTVDAEPARLSGPLIRRYLDVRLRGLV
ncbi:MAG: DUF58 domain-containing protein [Planctomycetota bacterium]|nr:MAG: DUF58 domain-containing protein [Planctomycetota bacterium]